MGYLQTGRWLSAARRYLDSSRDGLRHVALQAERVAQLAIVSFRPEVLVGCGANQLSVNTDPATVADYGALDDGINMKGSGNLWCR